MKKILKTTCSLLLIMTCNWAAGKTVTVGETAILLNGPWHLVRDPYNQGETAKWYLDDLILRRGELVQVPSNWDVANDGAGYKGKVWYHTSFQRPRGNGRRVLLSFEAVSMSYVVYINGKQVAAVLCGNYEEVFVIDRYLREGSNTLVVMVDNSLKWGAYYNWGGIRRPVKLLLRNKLSIENQQVVTMPDFETGTAAIRTAVEIYNAGPAAETVAVDKLILLEGKVAGKSSSGLIRLNGFEHRRIILEDVLDSTQVSLWDFDHPNLYTSVVQLISKGSPVYEQNERFGIRKIEVRNQQFLLNNHPVRLAGYNWIADDRTTGNTLPAFRFKEDIDLMKAAGANFARLSHRPMPRDVMDYLDEKGILVIAEFNNWPEFMNAESPEPRLFARKLIGQNFNHPCIVGWSVGNENGNRSEFPRVNEYVASIIHYIKTSLDSTRLVAYVSNTADFQDNDAARYCDLVLINKYGNYRRAVDVLSKRYPDKAIFMTEYGGYDANLIYDTPNHSLFRSLMVEGLGQNSHLFGYALWTFNDYRSEYQAPNPATTTPLHQNRQWGIVDVYRNKKRSYRQMQKFYSPVAGLGVASKKVGGDALNICISLLPRRGDEIPAFALRGYQVVWQLINRNERAIDLGSLALPDILPGDPVVEKSVSMKMDTDAALLKVSLLTPTGYVVKDTTLYLTKPPAPAITQVLSGDRQVRVLLDRNPFSQEYRLYCKKGNIVKCVDTTIDHYLQMENLVIDTSYKFWVTAVNGAGESSSSDIISFIPQAGYTVLPPVIWLSEPGDRCFFTGMSYHYTDNQYEIRYGTGLKDTASWHCVRSTQFGMMQVPGLENDKRYFYQLRRITAFNSTPGAWSEMKTIIPNAGHQYGTGKVVGYKQQYKKLIVSYISPRNARGFQIDIKTASGRTIAKELNQSVVEIISVPLPANEKVIAVAVRPLL